MKKFTSYFLLLTSLIFVMCDKAHAQIHCEIDTSTLDEGLYFLHFYENGELIVKQLIIEH